MSRIASAELVQIVLDAQQLQRVAAVAVGQIALQLAQARDLPREVPGIRRHRGQRDDQPEQEGRCRGAAVGAGDGHGGVAGAGQLSPSGAGIPHAAAGA